MIYTYEHFKNDKVLNCDVCIVGTGAAGSAAMASLAQKGLKVIALEAGSFLTPKDFTQKEDEMIPQLFYQGGNRSNSKKDIRVIHGRGVGGSTLHNINLCKPLPEEIIKKWNLPGFTPSNFNPYLEKVKKDIEVTQITDDQINENNNILKIGSKALGYKGKNLFHNRKGCFESGFCELGCTYNAKMNGLRVYIPKAVKAGSDVICNTKAIRLEYAAKKIKKLHAEVIHPISNKKICSLKINANYFISSAGAIEGPQLLLRSEIPDPHNLIGKKLHLHPGSAVCGIFPDVINFWQGIPQSYECDEFLDLNDEEKRIWLITGSAHPIGISSLLPGHGKNHLKYMKKIPNIAAITPMLHDHSSGSVSTSFGQLKIDYKLNSSDKKQMYNGIKEAGKILLAAGANSIILPGKEIKELKNENEIDKFLNSSQYTLRDLVAVHPMSSLWMGNNPNNSVTTPQGRYHQLENLYIADTSLYPTSIGIPPQLTTYSIGKYVANNLYQEIK